MKRSLFVLALLLFAVAQAAYAEEIYKWIDKNGNVSYHDQPPPDDAGYQVQEKDFGNPPPSGDNPAEAAARKHPVVIYVAAKCAPCDQALAYLRARDIPFTERNLDTDKAAQQALHDRLGKWQFTVPTILVGDKVMEGYMESLLAGELDDAGYPKAAPATAPDESAQ